MKVMNVVKVDSKKFRDVLAKRGLNCAEIAHAMGHSTKYFSNKTMKEIGSFTGADVTFLDKIYNIKPEDYQWVEPAPQKPVKKVEEPKPEARAVQMIQPVKVTNPIRFEAGDDLYKLIYTATYEAMKAALNS